MLVKMNKYHAVTGHEATVSCLVRIGMYKDDLSAWKNYLLTQRSDTRARHTLVTAIKNIACTAGQTAVRGGQRIRTAQFRFPVISRKLTS